LGWGNRLLGWGKLTLHRLGRVVDLNVFRAGAIRVEAGDLRTALGRVGRSSRGGKHCRNRDSRGGSQHAESKTHDVVLPGTRSGPRRADQFHAAGQTGPMAIDREELDRQLDWMAEHVDDLELTESREEYHAALMRMAGPDRLLDLGRLSEDGLL